MLNWKFWKHIGKSWRQGWWQDRREILIRVKGCYANLKGLVFDGESLTKSEKIKLQKTISLLSDIEQEFKKSKWRSQWEWKVKNGVKK